jgi:hypothetical protein
MWKTNKAYSVEQRCLNYINNTVRAKHMPKSEQGKPKGLLEEYKQVLKEFCKHLSSERRDLATITTNLQVI